MVRRIFPHLAIGDGDDGDHGVVFPCRTPQKSSGERGLEHARDRQLTNHICYVVIFDHIWSYLIIFDHIWSYLHVCFNFSIHGFGYQTAPMFAVGIHLYIPEFKAKFCVSLLETCTVNVVVKGILSHAFSCLISPQIYPSSTSLLIGKSAKSI